MAQRVELEARRGDASRVDQRIALVHHEALITVARMPFIGAAVESWTPARLARWGLEGALLAVLATAGGSAHAAGEGRWEDVTPSVSPEPRGLGAMVYDSQRKVIVLYGGSGAKRYGDTWERTATGEWSNVATTGPGPRAYHAMAYDAKRGRTVLFGGLASTDVTAGLGDTWEWDGKHWAQVATTGPSPREAAAMAYDEARENVVLYGGWLGTTLPAPTDTWTWDGASWTKVPGAGPGKQYLHAMAYDTRRKVVVLVGGRLSLEVYEWDGQVWTKPNLAGALPPLRDSAAFAFDSLRQVSVMFGGDYPMLSQAYGDTWEYDGTWEVKTGNGPAARLLPASAFDSARGRTVVFGGAVYQGSSMGALADTWEYHVRGNTCATNEECDTHQCVDGVCCDSVCGTCETCAAKASPGICTIIAGQSDPDSCDGTNTCGPKGTCGLRDGQACSNDAACATSRCLHGLCCDPACSGTCDAKGQCSVSGTCESPSVAVDPAGHRTGCYPYRCEAGGKCMMTCGSVDDCIAPASCDTTGRCSEPPRESASDQSGGCGVSGTVPNNGIGWACVVALAIAVRRRRLHAS